MALLYAFGAATLQINDQGTNGDYALYFLMGRNMFDGLNPGHLLAGYPAVLPVYPLIVGFSDFLFGTNFTVLAFIQALLWFMSCRNYARVANSIAPGILALPSIVFISLLFWGEAFKRTGEIQPTILFAWLLSVVLYREFRETYQAGGTWADDMVTLLFWWALLFARPEGLVIVGAILTGRILRRNLTLRLGTVGSIGLLSSTLYATLVSKYLGMTQYGGVSDASGTEGLVPLLGEYMMGLASAWYGSTAILTSFLPIEVGEVVTILGVRSATAYLAVLLGAVTWVMGLKLAARRHFEVLLILFGIGALYREAEKVGAVAGRYIVPYFPVYWTLLLLVVVPLLAGSFRNVRTAFDTESHNCDTFNRRDELGGLVKAGIAIPVVLLIGSIIPSFILSGETQRSFFYAPNLVEGSERLTDVLLQETDASRTPPVGFAKPRILQLKLSDSGVDVQVRTIRNVDAAERLCADGGVVLITSDALPGQDLLRDAYGMNSSFRVGDSSCKYIDSGRDGWLIVGGVSQPDLGI